VPRPTGGSLGTDILGSWFALDVVVHAGGGFLHLSARKRALLDSLEG